MSAPAASRANGGGSGVSRLGAASVILPLLALTLLAAAALLGPPLVQLWQGGASAAAGYDPDRMVFLYATLPRAGMALLCGAALGASGALLQQALRNPLASPTTLGIDAGGRLALAVATLWAPGLLGLGRDLVALGGSGLSTLLVFALVRRRGFAAVTLILAGLVVGLYAGALSALLTLLNERYLASLFIWGAGSLSQQSWEPLLQLALRLALLLPFALLIVRPLSLLDLDDASARARGLEAGRLRALAVLLAVAMSAFVVSAVGVVGFIGLVAPILSRLAGARGFGGRLLGAALIGALLLLLADCGVQLLAGASDAFLPTGAVTALLGSPLLLLLLQRLPKAERPPLGAALAAGASRLSPGASRLLVLGAALLLVALALCLGRDALTGAWEWLSPSRFAEILPWRWPRMVGAASAGAMLGLAGFILQRLTGNEMASPEVLGVSAGAAFAAALSLFLTATPHASLVGLMATGGSLAVIGAILALGRRSGFQPERVLLAGIALNALLDAVVGVLSATGDPRALMLFAWMAGSTSGIDASAALAAAGGAVLFTALALLAVRPLALLPLGAASASALGLRLNRARLFLFVLAAALTAAATPIVGPLTFAGLMAPHAARLLGVHRAAPALLVSALSGALLLVAADWLGRTLAYPWQMPTGIVAALIGAPALMLLLNRRSA
ncbi:Fe(3+)-hydroxamate ABC transporter permease FhuB [Aureimonas ureilytica]|uniref:Fe(3+)-hydroxamate ABC transporter permease FhuB n=1 Tax=Aureimonas ureilytica TaxID=401562 RepID=UPI00036153DC|nr:Fe(3+)-hydroxamate ABC transporter permease FhuB [Aureimonas ureilytica]